MKLDFIKMQSQGNDYIYFDLRNELITIPDFPKLARRLSSRHFSIGADGIVLIFPSDKYSAKMVMYNADGSRGLMCGSALRAVVGYLGKDLKISEMLIETDSGIKAGKVIKGGDNPLIEVDLGVVEKINSQPIKLHGFVGDHMNVGNSHFVIYTEKLSPEITRSLGAKIQNDPFFPDGVNVEFVQKIDAGRIRISVWERGSGITLACGTGAVAATFCGMKTQNLNETVVVEMPGGEVIVSASSGHALLKGKVDISFHGIIDI